MADFTKGPNEGIIKIRDLIRFQVSGGARFPGSDALREALEEIDEWKRQTDSPKAPLEPVSLADAEKVRRALEQIREQIAELRDEVGFVAWALTNQGAWTGWEHQRMRLLASRWVDRRGIPS